MNSPVKVDKLGPKDKMLIAMVGLPYSGKSTEAKQMEYPIVNPDSIRVALHGQRYVQEAEDFVWAICKVMVKSLFLAGHDAVILDATNLNKSSRKKWKSKDWILRFHEVFTPKHLCLERAELAYDNHIPAIIENMAERYEPIEEGEGGFYE